MKVQRCPTCHRRFKRSHAANARLWLLYHAIAEKLKPNGESYSAETWHRYFGSRFLGCEEIQLPNGKTMQIPHSTTELDVSEFGAYMEQIEAWAAERDVFLADIG